MEHCAIDLGARKSQICIRASDGTIVREGKVPTAALAEILKARPRSRVVLETCAEAFSIADAALAAGHEVRVVPATLVGSLGVGSRRTKTDQRDARILSEVSCRIDLPSVHLPKQESRDRKTMYGMRDALVSSRTMLINTVRGWLRGCGSHLPSGKVYTFPARVRKHLAKTGVEIPGHVRRQLETIEHLNAQVAESDVEVREIAERDELCRRLMTVPGVGPITSVLFVAALDEIGRFRTAHAVESYLGLVPGEHSSSERQCRTSITKAGSAALRRSLIQAAWGARRTHGDHVMLSWASEVEKRRGKLVAVVALARKIAGILFALWRDGTCYEPGRAAKRTTPTIDQALAALACGGQKEQAT